MSQAYLPLLHLEDHQTISMGPLTFTETSYGVALDVSPSIASQFIKPTIIDGVYILYFLAAFPYGQLVRIHLPTDPFRKIVFEPEKTEKTSRLGIKSINIDHAAALGRLLEEVYLYSKQKNSLLRALRFFVDRYFHPFGDALHQIADPEDITYLELAFESLFDLEGANQVPYLKQQVRMLLNLKFGRSLELMWKCIESFYLQLHDVVHGGGSEHEIYRANPNFSVPNRILLRNIFLIGFYRRLIEQQWLPDVAFDDYGFPRLEGFDHLDVILYFWDEVTLLRKISTLLMQLANNSIKADVEEDLHLLSSIWEKMHSPEHQKFFLPTDEKLIAPLMNTFAHLHQVRYKIDGEEKSFAQLVGESLHKKVLAFLSDFNNF